MNQFIVYRRADKAPVDYRTGKPTNAHDSSNWTDVDTASRAAQTLGTEWGIGFVLTEQAHIAVIDIDGCRNPHTGEISLIAQSLISLLSGAYVEISISGRGIHIWFTYSGVMPPHASRAAGIGEFYHRDRYICIGAPYEAPGFINGGFGKDHTASLPGLIAMFFPPNTSTNRDLGWTSEPISDWNGPKDDAELIRRAMQSRSTASAFSGRASFADLWLNNEASLGAAYPDAGGRAFDYSAADAALAQHLAFWTGCDCERIRRLMLASKLVRDKWDREDYLPRTILGAVARQSDVLMDKAPAMPASLTVPTGAADELTVEDFWAHLPSHKYINTRTRELIPVDALNGSLKRFTGSLGMKPALWLDMMRAVQQMNWQPEHPEIIEGKVCIDGVLKDDPKGRIYNLYQPSDAASTESDATLWVNHVNALYPEEATHLIQWMGYRIQNPGRKINHAVVLGGDQGIGKDWMLEPLRYGVGVSNFLDIEYKGLFDSYSEWAERTLLVINEARDTGGVDRYAFYENSKRLIAAPPDTLPCRKMYLGTYYVPNVMAVVITSNNKLNGLYIDPDDRRHFVAWSKSEKQGESYFAPLWEWMRDGGGKQAVLGYLKRLDVSGFNPMATPPRTDAWYQIVAANSNPEENSISDAIEGVLLTTVRDLIATLQIKGHMELAATLQKNPRKVPHLMECAGFEELPNPEAKSGRWRLGDGRKETLYVDRKLPLNERLRLALARAAKN